MPRDTRNTFLSPAAGTALLLDSGATETFRAPGNYHRCVTAGEGGRRAMEHLGNRPSRRHRAIIEQANKQADRGADVLRAGRATSKYGSLQNTFGADRALRALQNMLIFQATSRIPTT